MNKCAFCGKSHDLFTLPMETDDGEKYNKHICGSCWDVVAAIAVRACATQFAKKDHTHEEPDADIPGDFGTHQYHDVG